MSLRRRALRHRSFVVGAVLSAALVLAALLSLVWTPWPPYEIDVMHKLRAPSAEHWLGTDSLGRDVVSLLLVGARNSILVGVIAVGIGLSAGVFAGLLAAARRGCKVTSTDYVGSLLERGAERARADHLDVQFQVADAENLPFADSSFDVVLSTFGVMFTPDQTKAAAELLRVCRPGGRIGLANWTPDGFIGQVFKTLGRHLPPPAGVQPPSRWGIASNMETWFGPSATSIQVTPMMFNFRYRSAAHFIDVFRTWYGPVHKAFAALPAESAAALEKDLTELLNRMNRVGDRSLVVPSEYLEIVITRS